MTNREDINVVAGDTVNDAELLEQDLAQICALVEFRNAATAERKCLEALGGVEQSINDAGYSGWTVGGYPLYDFDHSIDRQRRPSNNHLMSLLRTAVFALA